MTLIDFLTIISMTLFVAFIFTALYRIEPTLNFNGHFKPHRHFFFEKRLKHYHWFWGKGDKMGCDVDYHGNTQWYCEECDKEISKNFEYKDPNIYGG